MHTLYAVHNDQKAHICDSCEKAFFQDVAHVKSHFLLQNF